jgi:hypothetical protein
MTGSIYKLYARQGAGSLAPQMLLEEIGAAYELIWISKAPADIEVLRRISPAAKIPALLLPDGTVVSESAAILIHSDQRPSRSRFGAHCWGSGTCPLPAVDGLSVGKRVPSGPAVRITQSAIRPLALLRHRRSKRKH